jgi:putative SOS response-associated peptidase YedK
MCFHIQLTATAQKLEQRFKAQFVQNHQYSPNTHNGFTHPNIPVITNTNSSEIQLIQWGLIPHWANNDLIKTNTLNARIETIAQKPAFRDAVNNRCLILANAFFEWQWLDTKGKSKQKYQIMLPNNDTFAFAGLWSEWTNKNNNQTIKTVTILTTQANQLMSRIHNSKKRMPMILSPQHENDWLINNKLILDNDLLIATPIQTS